MAGKNMAVLSARLSFHILHASSLKDKRQVCRSLIQKTRHRFNVSISEVDTHDMHQILTIGIAVVSTDYDHGNRSMDEIIRYMEAQANGDLIEVNMQ